MTLRSIGRIAAVTGLTGLLAIPATAQSLKPGAGKALVEGACFGCHQARQIVRSSGYTPEHWKELIGTMIDFSAAPRERDQIIAYLSKAYPPSKKLAPKLIPGPVKVTFKEWVTKTLGNRSRDPIEAPDGTIWWAGQWGNMIGSINPKTGAMKEYPLPENAKPHSVLLDRKGNVWYTGNKNGTVGYLDPNTGKITEYKMPDPAARDPHTAIFDRNGTLFFTLQHSNMIGRLNPETGDIKLVSMPTPGSKPYGIKLDKNDTPWVACNGGPCLVKVNPKTMALTEIKLPTPGTTVRRLDLDSLGNIWYVNSRKGKLGRYTPATGEIREWPSPSGPRSHPYAIVVINDIVWYNESRRRPDALVRFDPKTEKFQSWPIPSGNIYAGIIRHMRATKNGNIIAHQSSTNRIILVRIAR